MSNFKLHPMLRLVRSCLGNFLLISHVGEGYCNVVRIGQKNNWITLLSIISRPALSHNNTRPCYCVE